MREVYETRRKDVIRLIITEGRAFPKLAEFYYREVLSRIIAAVRALLRRAAERGEVPDALVEFPQMLAAPGLVAIIWSGLFERFEPLDVRTMMKTHLDLLFGQGERHDDEIAAWPAMMLAGVALAGCDNGKEGQLQGWVEAELIFVSPDEQGRVETLESARGRPGQAGRSAVHRRRRSAEGRPGGEENRRRQTRSRTTTAPRNCSRRPAGTQKTYRRCRGGAAPGQGQSGLVADAARRAATPIARRRHRRAGLLPPRRDRARRQAGGGAAAAAESQGALFRAGAGAAATIKYGETVTVSCDGCDNGLTAKVSFIARSAEFTPPVIYSLEERAKLVFLIEARPEQPEKFRVGQPVTVTLPKEPPK